jgi:hypothetical protein
MNFDDSLKKQIEFPVVTRASLYFNILFISQEATWTMTSLGIDECRWNQRVDLLVFPSHPLILISITSIL